MATGDLIEFLRPGDLQPDNGPLNQNRIVPVASTGLGALPLGKSDGYLSMFQVPINGTPLATGLTIGVCIVDDPLNPGAGKNVRLGVTVVPDLTTSGVLTAPAHTNEVLATVAVDATEGEVTIASVAVANAGLTSLAAGNFARVYVRRVGTDALDTHPGRVLLVGVSIKDT